MAKKSFHTTVYDQTDQLVQSQITTKAGNPPCLTKSSLHQDSLSFSLGMAVWPSLTNCLSSNVQASLRHDELHFFAAVVKGNPDISSNHEVISNILTENGNTSQVQTMVTSSFQIKLQHEDQDQLMCTIMEINIKNDLIFKNISRYIQS